MAKPTKYSSEVIDMIQKIAKDRKLLEAFMIDILTEKELREIGTRWEIVKQIHSGVSQRAIADALGVGVATVTRGAKEYYDEKGGFQQVITKFKL